MWWPLRRVLVRGSSMVPTLREGDQLLVWFGVRTSKAGQIVVIQLPQRPLSVKRIKAIHDGLVEVAGDNAFGSTDSRELGALPMESVQAVVLCRLWPRPSRLR